MKKVVRAPEEHVSFYKAIVSDLKMLKGRQEYLEAWVFGLSVANAVFFLFVMYELGKMGSL